MVLGFRHEGPAAYEVARKGLSRSSDETQSTTEVDDNLEISEVEAIEKPMSSEPRSQDVIFKPSKIDKPKLTIVGKIDLDDLNKYDRRQKKK